MAAARQCSATAHRHRQPTVGARAAAEPAPATVLPAPPARSAPFVIAPAGPEVRVEPAGPGAAPEPEAAAATSPVAGVGQEPAPATAPTVPPARSVRLAAAPAAPARPRPPRLPARARVAPRGPAR